MSHLEHCNFLHLGVEAESFSIGHAEREFQFFGENLEMRNDLNQFGHQPGQRNEWQRG